MGSGWSSPEPEIGAENVDEEAGQDISATDSLSEEQDIELTDEEIKQRRIEDLEKFKEDLSIKRELRKQKLDEVSNELNQLRERLENETKKRLELEEQLRKAKNDREELINKEQNDNKIVNDVEKLRISRYDEDDDEIDILEDEGEQKTTEIGEEIKEELKKPEKKKYKGPKKRVSFSLELVQEAEEDNLKIEEVDQATEETSAPSISANEETDDANTDESEIDQIKELTEQNKKLENQIKALKDVVALTKQLLDIRESQVSDMNKKLTLVEDKEKDYERKMTAIKQLRKLYEERGNAMIIEHKQQLEKERTHVTILESKLRFNEGINEELTDKTKYFQEKVKNMENQLDQVRTELSETKIKLATEKESLYHASSQIALINNLVSQIVSGPELDLDRLARFLEENHSLINELTAKGDINYVASALVGVAGGIVEVPKEEKPDIAENLGKVWRVLVELLSHHKKSEANNGSNQEWESCYKSVDTPKGPKLVISVSQTFIKLKDLILEKNSLVKEVGRLRKLNGHLESRMEEQESRLTLVTEELHNTWDVVNKLKRQHDSLHTHERILKHELQHKRSMLNGLKKQLEICREQWALAREKNSKTENDWLLLRAEFAMRKQKKKYFNSAESGYEEEEIQSPEYDTDDDKSIEIEEESPENSVNENIQNGNASPSEISNSEISDDGNGPISEILDSIFDEAIKITNNIKKETKINDITEPTIKENQIDININNSDEIELNKEEIYVQNESNISNYTLMRKHSLEQIPEVEENVINENQNDEENHSIKTSILQNETQISEINLNENQTNKPDEIQNQDNIQLNDSITETSTKSETGSPITDEILRRRDERLKRMEESCKSLFVKMGHTSNRSNEISNKLDQIHAAYGTQSSNQPSVSDMDNFQQDAIESQSNLNNSDLSSQSNQSPDEEPSSPENVSLNMIIDDKQNI